MEQIAINSPACRCREILKTKNQFMGLKNVLPLLAAAEALMAPGPANAKRASVVRYGLTPKQWEKRKRKLKQQKLSRKINRRKAL
jgi:hypothetical protein